ncbi:MAG: sulfatase [Opitutales bacterium]|nr:sulfatase [Opitutales bacterium]
MKTACSLQSLGLLALGTLALPVAGASERPNVLFISIDDLRTTVGAYGDPLAITPNIDRLAREGLLFRHHYVQQPSCTPSRASMLTGRRPDEIGVTNHATRFRDVHPDVVTLPQIFKLEGYEAVGIGKIFPQRPGFHDPASWTTSVYDIYHGRAGSYVRPENQTGRKGPSVESADVPDTAYLDGRCTDLAVDFLRRFRHEGTPFFLAVGYHKPHLPFAAPKRYWDLYDREAFHLIEQPDRPIDAPDIAFHDSTELRGYSDIRGSGPIPRDKAMDLRHGYYACVSYIDAQVGILLDTLDQLRLRNNTIIVLWSDHGFHLGELAFWGKASNFELDARSPLILSVPGMDTAGAATDAFVESLDLYPTLIDLAGIEERTALSGRSLRPLLEDPAAEWGRAAFTQFGRPYRAAMGGREPLTHMGYSVRVPGWRFTAWLNVETGVFEFPELYSLQDAPIESANLAGHAEHAPIEAELMEKIRAYSQTGLRAYLP